MRFNSVGAQGNYARAGKSAADDAIRTFAAARRSGPDYGKMAQDAANIRSKEKVAMNKIATDVARAGIKAKGDVTSNQIKIDGEMDYRKGKRKAGVLAAAGKFFASTDLGNKGRKKREVGATDSTYDRAIANIDSSSARMTELMKGFNSEPVKLDLNTSSPSSSSSSSSSSTASPQPVSGNNGYGTDMDYMKSLTDQGYTPEKAAAIVGNIRYETGDFKYLEEISPNTYGTKGLGILQWTDTGSSGGRRTNFTNWSKNQGYDPGSFQANAGYLTHEMSGADGDHWSGGGGLEGFKATGNLNDATSHFMSHYLRPAAATANLSERQARAADTLSRWNQQNGL